MSFSSRLAFVFMFTAPACQRGAESPASEETAAATQLDAPVSQDPTASKGSVLADSLDAAVVRAIELPQTDDATYRVDPFLAVLLFEHLTRTGGAPWFTPHRGDGADGAPAAGYRVEALQPDALPARLGLQEGDIVEAINGVVLTGADRLGFALDGAENRVTVTLHRDDVSLTHSYRLADGMAWRNVLAGFTGETDVVAMVDDAAPDVEGPAPAEPAPTPATKPRAPAKPSVPAPAQPSAKPQGGGGGSKLPSAGSKPTPVPGTKPTPAPGSGGPVSCSGTTCTVTKAHFDDLIAAPERLQSQAKVVPAIRNDVHSGYKLNSVKPGSTVAQLGFRAGDKITHVNGYDLTDDAQAMQLYWSLSATKVFKIRYERAGRNAVRTVLVK